MRTNLIFSLFLSTVLYSTLSLLLAQAPAPKPDPIPPAPSVASQLAYTQAALDSERAMSAYKDGLTDAQKKLVDAVSRTSQVVQAAINQLRKDCKGAELVAGEGNAITCAQPPPTPPFPPAAK